MLAFVFLIFFAKKMLPDAQNPQSLFSCPATTQNHSASCYFYFHDLHVAALFTRFSMILASVKEFLKKPQSFYFAAAVWAKPPTICIYNIYIYDNRRRNRGIAIGTKHHVAVGGFPWELGPKCPRRLQMLRSVGLGF